MWDRRSRQHVSTLSLLFISFRRVRSAGKTASAQRPLSRQSARSHGRGTTSALGRLLPLAALPPQRMPQMGETDWRRPLGQERASCLTQVRSHRGIAARFACPIAFSGPYPSQLCFGSSVRSPPPLVHGFPDPGDASRIARRRQCRVQDAGRGRSPGPSARNRAHRKHWPAAHTGGPRLRARGRDAGAPAAAGEAPGVISVLLAATRLWSALAGAADAPPK
jgi:hypothetical protein